MNIAPYFGVHLTTGIEKRAAVSGEKLIGIMGQSNAVGSCPIGSIPSDLIADISGNYILNNVSSQWESLQQNVNNAGTTTVVTGIFGIELRLMKLLHDNYGGQQYLFKYTLTGTQLAFSGSNVVIDWHPSSPLELFANGNLNYIRAIDRIPINMSMSWLIWMQGENDTANNTLANAYQTNLTTFINSLRTNYGIPNVKIILVSLSTGQSALDATRRTTVNTAMSNVAGALSNVFYYSQNNATFDGTHYGATALDNIATGVYNIIAAN